MSTDPTPNESDTSTTICDECSKEILVTEGQTCEHCGMTCCEDHIGDLDHDCVKEDE